MENRKCPFTRPIQVPSYNEYPTLFSVTCTGSGVSNNIILFQQYECIIKEISNCNIETQKGLDKFFRNIKLMFIEIQCAFHRVQCTLLIFQKLFASLSGTVPSKKSWPTKSSDELAHQAQTPSKQLCLLMLPLNFKIASSNHKTQSMSSFPYLTIYRNCSQISTCLTWFPSSRSTLMCGWYGQWCSCLSICFTSVCIAFGMTSEDPVPARLPIQSDAQPLLP